MLDPNYTCWTDGRSMAGDRPLLPSSSDSGRPLGPKALPNIRPPQQGQVPTGPFSTPAVGASAAASAMTLGTSIHDAYKAKNPPPFLVSSNEQLKALAEPDRAKWVAWFQASPAVSNYLDTRKALTESAAEYLHWYADAVREQLIKKAYTDYKAKFYPQIANAKQKLYPEMEVVLEKLEKEIEDCTKNVAIAWQKIAGGPTPYDLTKGRSIKVGQPDNPYWGLGYWQVGNTATSWEAVSAASGSDTLAIQKGLVPAAQFNLPALTLPPCGPLKEKTVSFFFGANPKVWDTSGMGPRLLKFVEFLANKPDTQWGFRYNSKTQTWYGPAVYKRLADWMAANLMDPLKAIAFAQVFANKGSTPYSISWVNDQLKFADISIESLKPGIEERQKKVEAANKVSLTALSAIPDGFERGMAAILGDQPSLLILSIVQAGIAKNLAEVAAQDIGSNWTLVQLSAYGAELQIASKGDIKEGVYFVVSVATNQASQVSKTVAGGQIGESNKQAGDAAGNLKRITDSAADTGVQTVTAEQLAAAEKAKKEAEEAAKKAAEEKAKQDAIIKAIEEASKKDYNYQTVTPVINKAAPDKVPLAGGEVVIEGLFFASNAVVAIGTTEVPATYVSPSQLKMTAPAASGPGAVDLTVTNPGETVTLQDGTTYQKKPASATLAKAFTYESPPAESAGSPLPLLALAIGAVALLRG